MFLSASLTLSGTGIRSVSHVTVTGVGSHSNGNGNGNGGGEKEEHLTMVVEAGLSPAALLPWRVTSTGLEGDFGDVGERRTWQSLRRVHLFPSAVTLAFLFYQRNKL